APLVTGVQTCALPIFGARLVRRVQAVEQVGDGRERDVRRDADPLVVGRLHQAPQRLPLHVVHHEEELVVGYDDVERGDDVLVAEIGRASGRGEGRTGE